MYQNRILVGVIKKFTRNQINLENKNFQVLAMIVLMTLLLHGEISVPIVDATALKYLHDFIQYNVAGVPIAHEKTDWDFDPEVGKQRKIRYEQENGRYGEIAIAKLGMGIGYKGPWGSPTKS